MKPFLLVTGNGVLLVLTSHESIETPTFLRKLQSKGIDKFMAFTIPLELAKERYGGHFDVVVNDLHETDDLRVLGYNGDRAFKLFSFTELGDAIFYET